jgi:hypothetical protein
LAERSISSSGAAAALDLVCAGRAGQPVMARADDQVLEVEEPVAEKAGDASGQVDRAVCRGIRPDRRAGARAAIGFHRAGADKNDIVAIAAADMVEPAAAIQRAVAVTIMDLVGLVPGGGDSGNPAKPRGMPGDTRRGLMMSLPNVPIGWASGGAPRISSRGNSGPAARHQSRQPQPHTQILPDSLHSA